MRNKKYRPIKAWIFLSTFFGIIFLSSLVIMDGWKKYAVLFCSFILLGALIISFTYWFEVKENQIVIRHALSSFNKQYRSSFKTRTIMINDISSIEIRDSGKTVIINLKNTNSLALNIGGHFNRSEIIQLMNEVNQQVKEQGNI